MAEDPERMRLMEILTSLALAIDLGLGVPLQTVLRTTLIAVRLARSAGLSDADVAAAYYLAVLRYIGCSTTSNETSQLVDEMALGGLLVMTDQEVLPAFERVVTAGKAGEAAEVAKQRLFSALGSGLFLQHHRAHCEAAQLIARRLRLPTEVIEGLAHTYERWDGNSSQRRAEGEGISLPMRVVQVAYLAGQDSMNLGAAEIGARVRSRAGSQLDPRIAALLVADPAHFLAGVDEPDLTQQVLAAEPGEPIWLAGDEVERGLSAIADFGDFKSPHMLGHSRRVANVAGAAARAAGLPAHEVTLIRHAALIHDIGRVGLHAQLLSKSGALSRAEHERIRLHSYLTGRIFADSPALAAAGVLGSAHHERLDGSGYFRGLSWSALSAPARLLAAANAWCALNETRPHRPQMTEPEAANELVTQAKAGQHDRKAVDAVLTACGQKGVHVRRTASLALSEREVEVLRLLSREHTNAAIAGMLGISPKTVERHVTHIYDKLGVATRAGAAIHALEHGLL